MTIRTTECSHCHWKYPAMFLSPFRSSRTKDFADVCGICALELSNEALGVKRKNFYGRYAEELRKSALDWSKRHPDMAPAATKGVE